MSTEPTDLSRIRTPYLHGSAKRVTVKGHGTCSAHLLPPGSIVLSSRAPIGYVAIPTVPFCTNQGCKRIELRDELAAAQMHSSQYSQMRKSLTVNLRTFLGHCLFLRKMRRLSEYLNDLGSQTRLKRTVGYINHALSLGFGIA